VTNKSRAFQNVILLGFVVFILTGCGASTECEKAYRDAQKAKIKYETSDKIPMMAGIFKIQYANAIGECNGEKDISDIEIALEELNTDMEKFKLFQDKRTELSKQMQEYSHERQEYSNKSWTARSEGNYDLSKEYSNQKNKVIKKHNELVKEYNELGKIGWKNYEE